MTDTPLTQEQSLAETIRTIRALQLEEREIQAAIKAQKRAALALMAQLGVTTYEDDDGAAYIRSASKRPGYKAKAVDDAVAPALVIQANRARALADLAAAGFVAEIAIGLNEHGEPVAASEVLDRLGISPDGVVEMTGEVQLAEGLETVTRALAIDEIASRLRQFADDLLAVSLALATARYTSHSPAGLTVRGAGQEESDG
jgi:hypothetical protein